MKKKSITMAFLIVFFIVFFLAGIFFAFQAAKPDSTKKNVVVNPQTEFEKTVVVPEQIKVLDENIDQYKNTGNVKSSEDLNATIDSIAYMELTPEQENTIKEKLNQLPESYKNMYAAVKESQ